MRRISGEGSFIGDPGRYVKKGSGYGPLSLHRGPSEEPGEDSLAGTFERKGLYIWVPFLDPEDNEILGLGAIWNFGKETVLPRADIRLWGTKGPSLRPRCIGIVRTRTQCK